MYYIYWASLMAQMVKESACNGWGTQVQSRGQEDPLERKWQPTPVFLPGKSRGLEPGSLQSMGLQRVGHN